MQAAFFRLLDNLVEVAMAKFPERKPAEVPQPDMLAVIEQARREWLNTDRYFDCVSDPALIDHAILLKGAAQKKYMYLLRQARLEGLKAFSPEPASDVANGMALTQATLARE